MDFELIIPQVHFDELRQAAQHQDEPELRSLSRPNLAPISTPLAVQEGVDASKASIVYRASWVHPKCHRLKKGTPVFYLYFYCSVNHNKKCPVKYRIALKDYAEEDNGNREYQAQRDTYGRPPLLETGQRADPRKRASRACQSNQQRTRRNVARKRLGDKATNESVPALVTYQKVKSEDRNKTMLHSDWLFNLRRLLRVRIRLRM